MRRIKRIDLCSDEPDSCDAMLIAAIASMTAILNMRMFRIFGLVGS